MDKNENIKSAREELKQVSGDYELRRIAELKEKYIRDEAAALDFALEKGQREGFNKGLQDGLEQGLEQGLQQGLQQGKNEANIQTAKNMLELGLDIEIISKSTGLSKEKILELK